MALRTLSLRASKPVFCKTRQRSPLETSLRFSEEKSPPNNQADGLVACSAMAVPQTLVVFFFDLGLGKTVAKFDPAVGLARSERASWSLCYGRFIAPCSKERLQSHASPCTHHVSSSLPAYIDLVLLPYRFRIVSASGSENDRRTIGERYGINTGLIRD